MPKRATSIVLGATAVLVPLLVAMKSVVATMPDSQAFGQIERGRYLGLVLFSAQQFRSQVQRRVVGNAGWSIADAHFAEAVENIKARLSELAYIVKEGVVDGWANVSPGAKLKLDEWMAR